MMNHYGHLIGAMLLGAAIGLELVALTALAVQPWLRALILVIAFIPTFLATHWLADALTSRRDD